MKANPLAVVGITAASVFLGLGLLAPPAMASGNGSFAANSLIQQPHDGAGSGHCALPAQVLNLTDWKLTVPLKNLDKPTGDALQIAGHSLANFQLKPWFVVQPSCKGVRFRAAVNGVTTKGSTNPRTELRERTDGGRSNASWSSNAGTHTMTIREAITHLPAQKPDVVAGQIHDAGNDLSVFRLEGHKLYITNGNDNHYKLVISDYVPGTVFEARFVVSDGKIKAYYNGVLQATVSKRFSGAYFKAGVYTQANCSNTSPCSERNYGEVVIYKLTVSHT